VCVTDRQRSRPHRGSSARLVADVSPLPLSITLTPPPSTRSTRDADQVIEELDEKKKSALKATWLKVNQDFGAIFSTLLPGTQAKLEPPEGESFLDGEAREALPHPLYPRPPPPPSREAQPHPLPPLML